MLSFHEAEIVLMEGKDDPYFTDGVVNVEVFGPNRPCGDRTNCVEP